jgi:hypothetical protein
MYQLWVGDEMESAGCSASTKQDYLRTVGGLWGRRSQWVVLQLSNNITYFLWAGDVRDGVSEWLCSYPARSRTLCGRAMGEMESVGGCVAIEQDHTLPVGRQWERQCQQVVVQLLRKITYFL